MPVKYITKEDIDRYSAEEDYYKLLGVDKKAETSDIEKAFRKLSVTWHPDKVKVKDEALKENATKIFKKLNEAKEVLCDEKKRQIFDKFGLEGLKEHGPEQHPEQQQEMMQEFMKQMFGEQLNRGSSVPDINIVEEVTLEDLWSGKEYKKQIDRFGLCKDCNGYGTEDGLEHKCGDCGGSGVQVKVVKMGPMIQQSQQMCGLCRGSGSNMKVKKCEKCTGKKVIREKADITVKIPKGAYEGIGVSIRNEGNEIPMQERDSSGKSRTNVNIKIKEKKHPLYERGFKIPKYKESVHPKDLKLNLKISLVESLTGFTKSIKTVDGKSINLVHDKIVKHGDILVIPNKAMPIIDKQNTYGHVFVVFDVEYPDDLNNNLKRRLWQLLTNTNYKELDDIKDKVTLESAEKYKFENLKDPNMHHFEGFPFPQGFMGGNGGPFKGGPFGGGGRGRNDSDDSDNNSDDNNMGGQNEQSGPECKVQ